MKYNNREDIIQLTPLWTGERFDDGRPRVSDDILRRMKHVKTEEAWSVLWGQNYHFQFEGNWVTLHPERVLVGRAVTGVFVPTRPDLHDYLMTYGHEQEQRIGAMNSWVIQTLVKDDAIVIDHVRQGLPGHLRRRQPLDGNPHAHRHRHGDLRRHP